MKCQWSDDAKSICRDRSTRPQYNPGQLRVSNETGQYRCHACRLAIARRRMARRILGARLRSSRHDRSSARGVHGRGFWRSSDDLRPIRLALSTGRAGVGAAGFGPFTELLTIRIVRTLDGHITGHLEPYWDPDRHCQASTTFLGSVDGDRIRGTFTSKCDDDSTRILNGRWTVHRRR